MVEDSSKTVSAPLKVHINTRSGSATFYEIPTISTKILWNVFYFFLGFFSPPIKEILCSSYLHHTVLPLCLFFSRFCCQNLCCQNYRQTRVRHALIACLHWRAICTVKSEYVGGIDWRSVCFFFSYRTGCDYDLGFWTKIGQATSEPCEFTEGKSILNYGVYRGGTSIFFVPPLLWHRDRNCSTFESMV